MKEAALPWHGPAHILPICCLPLTGTPAYWALGWAAFSPSWFIFPSVVWNNSVRKTCFLGLCTHFPLTLRLIRHVQPSPCSRSFLYGSHLVACSSVLSFFPGTYDYLTQHACQGLFFIFFWPPIDLGTHAYDSMECRRAHAAWLSQGRASPRPRCNAQWNLSHCLESLSHARNLTTRKQARCWPNRWAREIGRPKPMDDHEMTWLTGAKGVGNGCSSLWLSFHSKNRPVWVRVWHGVATGKRWSVTECAIQCVR